MNTCKSPALMLSLLLPLCRHGGIRHFLWILWTLKWVTIHIRIDVVRDGFTNKMVLGAWTVWAGGNTSGSTWDEKDPINTGLRLERVYPVFTQQGDQRVWRRRGMWFTTGREIKIDNSEFIMLWMLHYIHKIEFETLRVCLSASYIIPINRKLCGYFLML